ncbi:hypothetical protein [Novosphingobium terrae]|uniref:hypothetical protein n=1 Tax=Novosphingobium terrae TaxID=2726189 RepID=UPI0019812CBE|nr:hypothetical protein [Novosphingobium terrae]
MAARLRAAGALALLLITTPAMAAGAASPFWLKSWTVKNVRGDLGAETTHEILNKKITLGDKTYTDPLSSDCKQSLSYADIKLRPSSGLKQHFGASWKFPKLPGNVWYGWVRCDGANVEPFAFVDKTHAYIFYENGAIIELN